MGLEYPKIDPEREFRLIRLHPRYHSTTAPNIHEFSSICCDLFVATLGDATAYQALSYVWGKTDDRVLIHVNCCEHRITPNLYLALKHLREEHESVVIWIDAICIDQENDAEKTKQVSHMTEIYTSAKCTIAWLGLSADGSDPFLEKCNRIGGDLVKRQIMDGHITRRFSELTNELTLLPQKTTTNRERYNYLWEMITRELVHFIDEAQQDIRGTIAFFAACNSFMSRRYWKRIWIWQEFFVSPNVVLQCGNSKIMIPEFNNAVYFQIRLRPIILEKLHGEELKAFLGIIENPRMRMLGRRRAYQELRKDDPEDKFILVKLLASAFVENGAEAEDNRDRVFALLGIAKDTRDLGLAANYDKSVSDILVYTNTAHAIIAAGHVDLLALSQRRLGSDRSERVERSIPSWVPDWLNPISLPFGQYPWDTEFAASGDMLFKRSLGFERALSGQLELLGWVIDTVEELSPAWINPGDLIMKNRHNVETYLRDITSLCEKSNAKYSSTGQNIYLSGTSDRQSAHFLVPIADQYMNDDGFVSRASESCRKAHADLLSFVSTPRIMSGTQAFKYLEKIVHQRLPFLSKLGYVGLAPNAAENGDLLVIFCGAKLPYLIRRSSNGKYNFVGEAYAHGIMYGQFMKRGKESETLVLE